MAQCTQSLTPAAKAGGGARPRPFCLSGARPGSANSVDRCRARPWNRAALDL